MKLTKQIIGLLLVAAIFVCFNTAVYFLLTRRCAANFDTSAKSIQVEDYLPFAPDSKIVHVPSSLHLTEHLPVLDGATALLPVYSAVAAALYPADTCPFADGQFAPDSAVQYRNTIGAYQAVVDGTADLIFCAQPSQEQLDYAKEHGVDLTLVPIGNEAFVFLVHSDNPVDSLTSDQIRGIYAGDYSNWSAVGGANRPILPLQRKERSGSQTAMLAFMDGTPMKKTPFRILGGAIGYSFRYYAAGMVQNERVKLLAVDGVYPDREHIASGEYPIVNNLYAVYRSDNSNENIPIILSWLLSDEGQKIINDSGYVGLQP